MDEEIQLAIADNRSIERATMMAALKLAGELISSKRMVTDAAFISLEQTALSSSQKKILLSSELKILEGKFIC